MAYYIRVRGQREGPFDEAHLKKLVERGQLARHYEVSTDGRAWQRASEFPQFFPPEVKKPAVVPTAALHSTEEIRLEPAEEIPLRSPHFEPAPASPQKKDAKPKQPQPLPPRDTPAVASSDTAPRAAIVPTQGKWRYAQGNTASDPVEFEHLQFLIDSRQLGPGDLIWQEGMEKWISVASLSGLSSKGGRWRDNPAGQQTPLSLLAAASLVLSLLWLGGLGSIAAIVLGASALYEIGKSKKRGRGLAIAGLILGAISLVGTIFMAVILLADISLP